jgi:hypothetical protein
MAIILSKSYQEGLHCFSCFPEDQRHEEEDTNGSLLFGENGDQAPQFYSLQKEGHESNLLKETRGIHTLPIKGSIGSELFFLSRIVCVRSVAQLQ